MRYSDPELRKLVERAANERQKHKLKKIAATTPTTLAIFAGVIGVGAGSYFLTGYFKSRPAAEKAACGIEDKACYAERFTLKAQFACKPKIEQIAKWSSRFDYSFGGMFSRYEIHAPEIVYYGDRAEFQNGFGAWKRVHYSCAFTPASGAASVTIVDE